MQTDRNNVRLQTTIVALITSNTSRVHEATQLFIDMSKPDGAASGLLHDSAVKAENLLTIAQVDIRRVIGHLQSSTMDQVSECIKQSLGIS